MNWEELLVDIVDCFIIPLAKIWVTIYCLGVICYCL